jgi:hypothetical protein
MAGFLVGTAFGIAGDKALIVPELGEGSFYF